jgi:CRISPR-associated protein Cmr1
MPTTPKLEATFSLVTPMYLGGANQEAGQLRAPSVKGALRFWWRALNWGRVLTNAQADEFQALRQLHTEEARLFGSAATDSGGGQGVFLLSVPESKVQPETFNPSWHGLKYLQGQGLSERQAFKPGGSFTVHLRFKPGCSEPDRNSIAQALFAFGLLGGLGSRARHGFGSVALTAWAGSAHVLPTTRQEYAAALRSFAAPLAQGLPPFSAFSKHTRMDISTSGTDALKLLEQVGAQQQLYRSFGQNGKVGGREAEKKFKSDHDLVLALTQGQRVSKAPERAVFGLPHNYFFSSTKAKADLNYSVGGEEHRRASPLLLHVHRLQPSGECLAVHTLFQARFLPPGAQITGKVKGKPNHLAFEPNWAHIHTFLDRPEFKDRERLYG